MLIKNAEVAGNLVDLRVTDIVVEMGANLIASDEPVVDARGGALLPGLHDHHIHLYAAAMVAASVNCSDLPAGDAEGLARRMRAASSGGWLRVVGYHESLAGDLDRYALDELSPGLPARVQHSSGKLWVLNSAALQLLGLAEATHPGIERASTGVPTGRLWRMDDWVRERIQSEIPDLGQLSKTLAEYGVTGVTDTSYTNNQAAVDTLRAAQQSKTLMQRLLVMGDDSLSAGPLKIMLDEDDLPELEHLAGRIVAARRMGRSVAFHCVSHLELVFALAALRQAGFAQGDRIEHGGVVRTELLPELLASGVTVVTQPGFVWARGARYKLEADAVDLPFIYPFASLLDAGVPVVASSDAPYGPLDPWLCMATAVTRRCADGSLLNPREAVAPEVALGGYLTSAEMPGGAQRVIEPGAPADFCLLDLPLSLAMRDPSKDRVRSTILGGERVYDNSSDTS